MTQNHTLETMLRASGGRPSGFDYIRPILAFGVIANHTNLICYGDRPASGIWAFLEPISYVIIPAFFALSGFLVAGSLERCGTLISFLGLRVFRIFPALIVEVLISAIIIGPMFTSLSLGQYIADPLFVRYFLNMLGEPQYHLPGVFTSNPSTLVNGQIWTIPYELICYIVLSVIAILAIYRRSGLLIGLIALAYVGQIFNTALRPNLTFAGPTGLTAVICFVVGVTLFRFRERVLFSRGLFLVSLVATLALAYLPSGVRFMAVPVSYLTVYLGLLNPPKLSVLEKGDYSYGIYLYGFPIQQALYSTAPVFQTPLGNGIGSALLAAAVAAFSWHFVEVPFMARKKAVYRLEHAIAGSRFAWLARALTIHARHSDAPGTRSRWESWFAIYPVHARVILDDLPHLPPILESDDDKAAAWRWLSVVERKYEDGRWQYAIRGRRMTKIESLESRAAP